MSYSTRRIESVAPSIKRYDANLPTMICANRLAPAVLFSIGCAGLPAATHRCCDPCAAATSEISPSHSPTGSGRMTRHSESAPGEFRQPTSLRVADHLARASPPELQGGCCLEPSVCFVISRHRTRTDVIDPAMQGKIALFQSSRNRGM